MFANLSAVILYYWAIRNDKKLLAIIPILLLLRNTVLLLSPTNFYRRLVVLEGTPLLIEYYLSIVTAALVALHLLGFLHQPIAMEYWLLGIGAIFVGLLILRAFSLLKSSGSGK